MSGTRIGANLRRQRFRLTAQEADQIVPFLCDADIVVFYNAKPEIHTVAQCQKIFGFPSPSFTVTHVALYAGEGRLCHSNPGLGLGVGGVTCDPFSSAIADKTISILRFQDFQLPENKHIAYRISALARLAEGCPYDFRAIYELAIGSCQMLINQGKGHKITNEIAAMQTAPEEVRQKYFLDIEAFTCSDFIFNCFDEVLGWENPLNQPKLMITPNRLPAEIYLNEKFEEINELTSYFETQDITQKSENTVLDAKVFKPYLVQKLK